MAIVIMQIYLASAMAEYYQFKIFINNESAVSHQYVRNHMSFYYTKEDNALIMTNPPAPNFNWWFLFFPFLPIVNPSSEASLNQWDYVKAGSRYEADIQYSMYPQTWNSLNPDMKVQFCNLSIKIYPTHSNNATNVFSRLLTYNDTDILNGHYFVRLNDGDFVSSDIDCKYYLTTSIIDIPADFFVNTPTWECKACQYHNWLVQEQQVQQAKTMGSNIIIVFTYIKGLFSINFEFVIFAFWIAMILLIFVAVGLIFFGVYWLYSYMRRLAQ
jgi:hypothetical protein